MDRNLIPLLPASPVLPDKGQVIKLVKGAEDALKSITGKMSRKTCQVSPCPKRHTLFSFYSQSCCMSGGEHPSRIVLAASTQVNKYDV